MEHIVQILENINVAKDTFKMVLESDFYEKVNPGHFINIKIEGLMLRRPISISSVEKGQIVIYYKIVGEGTEKLSHKKIGDNLNILAPLGRFFPIHEEEKDILIIGGGIGIAPLYEVAKRYRKLGANVVCVLGYNDIESIYLAEDFKNLGCNVYISTMDGSFGYKGIVFDIINPEKLEGFVYSCGPEKMLKFVEEKFDRGYISKEQRMACGIGACMGCVCKNKNIKNKYYRICKEGPVFEIGKVE